MQDFIGAGLRQAIETLNWFYEDADARAALGAMVDGCVRTLNAGGRVLTCGNGGSFCDAAHLAEELSGRFRKDRPALAGLALSDGSGAPSGNVLRRRPTLGDRQQDAQNHKQRPM